MKRATLLISVASLALGASTAAVSSDIYKWVDEDGSVHYQDRPTEGQAAELLNIESRTTDNEAVYAQTQARLEAQAAADLVESAATPALTRQEKNAKIDERQRQCKTLRDRHDQYVRSRAIYNEDENGNRIYQDDSERQATRNKIQSQIQEYCGS